ncbi:MAG: hypothetical protein KDB53_12645 [Planctomycetes bacterium]|nr:hypothetical protein [Planctomycetota bacterium]
MIMTCRSLFLILGLTACLSDLSPAQRGGPPPRGGDGPRDPVDLVAAPTNSGIAWFGRWTDAKAEAARTGRPILVMSAAPRCTETPGIW